MGLYFQNKTGETLFVAYAYHHPGCEGGVDWAKKGWYQIAPGGTAKVLSGWVGGSKFFYFAEAADRSPAWSGPFFTQLPVNAFDWCWLTGSTSSRNLGLRKLEIAVQYQDWTVGLTA
jgi:uncharacterized membrane protein